MACRGMVRSAIILLTSCVFVGRRGFQGPTNLVIGSTAADDDSSKEWLALDHKLNSYPTLRGFTAIGTCGQDFVQAMLLAEYVKQKLSSGGKYVSVNIGPIQVVSSEQVQAVYNAMRRDDRVKYFL